ncbi:MAG: hypothetical protein JW838_04365 [Spirochaetes bacterium]|nr:hypothetical protein [Spirochaetota bacterium]
MRSVIASIGIVPALAALLAGLIACSHPVRVSIDGSPLYPIRRAPSDLRFFAHDFAAAFGRRDWDRVLGYFDRANYRAQLGIGIDTEQYLIEGMGLNPGDLEAVADATYPRLTSIVVVKFVGYETDRPGYYATLYGYAVTGEGKKLRIILLIKKDELQGLVVSPPVG